jgi:hypothetical protein
MAQRTRSARLGAALLGATLAALAPAAQGAPQVCLSESEAFCCAPKNRAPDLQHYSMESALGCSATWDASSCPGELVEYVPPTALSAARVASSAECECGRQGDPYAWTFDCALLECTTGTPTNKADNEGICILLGLVEDRAARILGLGIGILVAILVAILAALTLLVWWCGCRKRAGKTAPAPEKVGSPAPEKVGSPAPEKVGPAAFPCCCCRAITVTDLL